MIDTSDVKRLLQEQYSAGIFRTNAAGVRTVELRGIQFLADKPWIIREPNYEYANREIAWYESESLNVYDMDGTVPKIWQEVCDVDGYVNSNYGWMVFSRENGSQYKNCLWNLKHDPQTRQAVMLYTRPSMQQEWNRNHMHDFCCTYATQVFLDKKDDGTYGMQYIVYQRSCDAVFGYDNDCLWHMHIVDSLKSDLEESGMFVSDSFINYNCGSLHVYDRHLKYLE